MLSCRLNCVDRQVSLLAGRFGFGADVTGGFGAPINEVSTVAQFVAALTSPNPEWIVFDPAVDNVVWQMPAGYPQVQANKTIDGRGSSPVLQFGIPNSVVNGSTGQPSGLAHYEGNVIWHCTRLRGTLADNATPSGNGDSDGIELFAGDRYWIDHNEFRRFSDEAVSTFHQGDFGASEVTVSNNLFEENKAAHIWGNSGNKFYRQITLTQAYNLYLDNYQGRAPGNYFNTRAHVYNNYVDGYNFNGYYVGQNAEVISQSNVLLPRCVAPNSFGQFGRHGFINMHGGTDVPGQLWSNGDIVIPQVAPCEPTQDTQFLAPPTPAPFTIPYAYMLGASERQGIEDYVRANAGVTSDKVTEFC